MGSPNLFRQAKGENRIFRDESVLTPDFLPDEMPGREREIRELVYCLQPASENKQPEHALLTGPPGTGKTSSSRHVLKQLSEYSQRPLTIYINCWEYSSRFAIFSFLSAAIGEPMPRRGIAADEVMDRFIEIAKKEGRIPIIVLDEVDRLETSEEGVQVLYDLCRANELHSLKTGVIAITNDELFHTRLDNRVRSSFIQHTLSFKPYTVPQLKEILKERAGIAFAPDTLDDDVAPLCAAIAFKRGGDARVALALLLSAGKTAERENSPRVLVQHVRQIEETTLQSSAGVKATRKQPEMDDLDATIVDIARDGGKKGVESGALYQKLKRYIGERALRNRIESLEKSGILTTEDKQLPQGRTRIIRIKE
ncbi:MAG: AAA family ATPase [Candidatus Micrarchaeota archaeon]|nr:AAA family ATPase [Candidatus Micrarchaeota archaeon]